MISKLAQKKRNSDTYSWFFDESVFAYFSLLEIARGYTIFPFDVIQLILMDYLEVQHSFAPKVGLTVQSSIIQTYQGFYIFGCNGFGQHASGDTADYASPHLSPYLSQLTSKNNTSLTFSCGGDHILLHAKDGLYGWGYNGFGQLGLDTNENICIPERLPLQNIIMFCCGGDHSVVVTDQGIFTFGYNQSGQLGHKDNTFRSNPTLVNLDTIDGLESHLDIYSVVCSYNTSVLLTTQKNICLRM